MTQCALFISCVKTVRYREAHREERGLWERKALMEGRAALCGEAPIASHGHLLGSGKQIGTLNSFLVVSHGQ